MKEWALEHGATHYTHWFQPLTGSTAEKHDSFYEPDGRRHRARRVLRQGADPGRARRVLVPHRRHPRDVRGARLHRLGPDARRPSSSRTPTARCCASRPRSRRGPARRSTTRSRCCARWTRCRRSADPRAEAAGRRGRQPRLHDGRPRAGVLPDRRAVLLRAPRPGTRPGARCSAPSRPRATSSTTTTSARSPSGSSPTCSRPSASCAQARRPGQDAPQRGRAQPVRAGADLRELQRRLRPPAADDADHAERGPALRPGLPAAREAVRRRQRLGQAQQLVDGHRHRASTCSSRATRRTRTSRSCSSARR